MGVAVTALSDAYRLVRHNPVVVGVGWAAAVALTVATGVLYLVPLVGPVVAAFLGPAFLAGFLSLAYSGRDGDADASDFLDGVGDHYLSLLGASLLLGFVMTVLGVGSVAVAAFVAPMGSGIGGGGLPTAVLVPLAVVGFLLLVLSVLLQFFDVAIVVDGASALGAFERSASAFATAPLSVLGYTVLRALIGGLFFVAPMAALSVVATGLLSAGSTAAPGSGLGAGAGAATLALVAVYFLVVVPLGYVATLTYHVAFYNRFTHTVA